MRDDYALVTGVPPGLAKESRAQAQQAWEHGIGGQSALQPSDRTSVRPNTPTERDNEGVVTTAATSWIIAGDLQGATLDDIAQVLADWLEVPVAPIKANLEVVEMSHAEVLAELRDNPVLWGEGA